MAQQQSKLPSGENLSRPMIAYLQNIESRVPSNTTPIDGSATLADVIARFNALIVDLNK
jgi:hypothetical protein